MKKNAVAIGIGSNLGQRLVNIQTALKLLQAFIADRRVSSVVESSALLLPGSPVQWDMPYLNCVLIGHTELSPRALLQELKKIENHIGPPKVARWAPRALDLDILSYEDLVIQDPDLIIPHKEMLHRPFVIHPLAQLTPYWKHPVHNKTLLELAHEVPAEFHRSFSATPLLMGILNLTPDSFSDGGLFVDPEKAIAHAKALEQAGASFIDLGAASTRPGTKIISHEEEWQRLSSVLPALNALHLSLDTYHNETALRALRQYDLALINFQGDTISGELAQEIEQQKKQLVIMHHLGLPPSRTQVIPYEDDPIQHILSWAQTKIEELESKGLDRTRLILDPGIGFGKTALQNMLLLKRVQELKKAGLPLLVGHSRKSFMQLFSCKEPSDRDLESAALSLYLAREGVEYLRVHNVELHRQQLCLN